MCQCIRGLCKQGHVHERSRCLELKGMGMTNKTSATQDNYV